MVRDSRISQEGGIVGNCRPEDGLLLRSTHAGDCCCLGYEHWIWRYYQTRAIRRIGESFEKDRERQGPELVNLLLFQAETVATSPESKGLTSNKMGAKSGAAHASKGEFGESRNAKTPGKSGVFTLKTVHPDLAQMRLLAHRIEKDVPSHPTNSQSVPCAHAFPDKP